MLRIVVLVVIVGVRTAHVVGRERWEMIPRGVIAVGIVWMVSIAMRWHALSLYLGRGGGQQVDIQRLLLRQAIRTRAVAATIWVKRRRHDTAVLSVRVWRRDIGRADSRDGRGA